LELKPTGGYLSRNRVGVKNLQEGISPGTGLELKPSGGYLSRNRVGVKTYRRVLFRNRVGVKTYRRLCPV
jgi:hypothetical protein